MEELILYRIHSFHHSLEILVIQFITPHKEIVMKEVRIAQGILKKEGIKLTIEKGRMVAIEIAVETMHQAIHFGGVTCCIAVECGVCRIEANKIALLVKVPVHLYVDFWLA